MNGTVAIILAENDIFLLAVGGLVFAGLRCGVLKGSFGQQPKRRETARAPEPDAATVPSADLLPLRDEKAA